MKTFYTKMYLMKILQCIHAQYTKSKETKKMGYVDEVLAKVKEKNASGARVPSGS